jgi:aspartyl-tRNA synthetase
MEEDGAAPAPSKKAAQKAAKKAERLLNRQLAASALSSDDASADDPLSDNYGDVPFESLQSLRISGREWTKIARIDPGLVGKTVLLRGRILTKRGKGKIAFLVVREAGATIQVVFHVEDNLVSKGLIKFVDSLSKESIVDVEGVVDVPEVPVSGTTQQVLLSLSLSLFLSLSHQISLLPFP